MNAIVCLLLVLSTTTLYPQFRLFDRARRDGSGSPSSSKKDATPNQDTKARKEDRPRGDDKLRKDEPPADPYEVEEFKNIAYRDDRDADAVKHKLDVFVPKGQRDFPVLFFVHGGGWHSGSKELYTAFGEMFARNGIGAVVINYRLTPKVVFPAHIEDVAKAFAWTKDNIGRYGGRPDRIICYGHSAGGHLVSLLATDEKYLKAEKCSFKDIRCVVTISGAYALDEIYGLWPSVFGRNRADRREASPLHHVSKDHPPFFILYAEKDLPTVERVSGEFFEALRKAKVDVREQMVPQRTHVSIILLAHKFGDPTTEAIFDFIERHTEWKRPVPSQANNDRKMK